MCKILSLLCFTALVANALPQTTGIKPTLIQSVRIHATTRSEGAELQLTVITKPFTGIRATIRPENTPARAVVLFTKGKLYLIKEQESIVEEITGYDAAKNIFEMLALSPDLNFRTATPAFETPLLDGYTIRIEREKAENHETQNGKPLTAKLYRKSDEKLLRTILYTEFFPQNNFSNNQPKVIEFTDHDTNQTGTINIHKVDYNVGIGDFVFSTPK